MMSYHKQHEDLIDYIIKFEEVESWRIEDGILYLYMKDGNITDMSVPMYELKEGNSEDV